MAIKVLTNESVSIQNLPTISDASNASCTVDNKLGICVGVGFGVGFGVGVHTGFAGSKPAITNVQEGLNNSKFSNTTKGFLPAVKPSHFVNAQLHIDKYAAKYHQCLNHAKTWQLTPLQQFYKAEYNSFRSRKQQAKSRHIKFDDRLKDFRDWLIHLGPRPSDGWTVHRINNYKGYVPGNIKWATKIEQTEIRKVTKWHDVDGKKMTTKQLSKHLGLTYSCLYKRIQTGWTMQRLLDAQKKNTGIKGWVFPPELTHVLEPRYAERKTHAQTRLDWFIAYLTKILNHDEHLLEKEEKQFLTKQLWKAQDEHFSLWKKQNEQTAIEIKQLLSAYTPPKVTGFS